MKLKQRVFLRFLLAILVILKSNLIFAQIQQKQVGHVFYHVIPFNQSIVERNDSIATYINNYILQNSPKSFPPVLLYISDQSQNNSITNFEFIQVYYQEFVGQMFEKYSSFTGIVQEHVGIHIALRDNHFENAIISIKHAVRNLKNLKKELRIAIKKQRQERLNEEDLDYSYLFKRNINGG